MSGPSLPRHIRELVRELHLKVVDARRGKHWVLRLEDEQHRQCVVTMACSPSCSHATANARALIRKGLAASDT